MNSMTIIKISAMWCPACIIMNKFWNEIEEEFPYIEFISYDLDMDEEEVKKYNVGNTLPVIIMIKNNKETNRLIGEKTKAEIMRFIKEIDT